MRGVAYFAAEITPHAEGPYSDIVSKLPSAQEIRGTFLLAKEMNIADYSFMHLTDLGADLEYLKGIGFLTVTHEPLSLQDLEELEHRRIERIERIMMEGGDWRSRRFDQEEIIYSDSRWNEIEKGSLSQAMRLARIISFEKLYAADPTYWSLCSTGDGSLFDKKDHSDWNAAGISLRRAIPVPDKEVPLEDIRIFKEHREAELIHLWHALDEANMNILKSPLPSVAHQKEIENLKLAATNMQRVSREWKVPKRLVDIHSKSNFPISTVFASALASQGMINHQLILGGVAADLCFSLAKGIVGFRKESSPYEYITRYHSELFSR